MTGRVLVVDDEPSARTAAVRVLERAGFDVEGVGGAREAVACLEAGPFDVAVVDLLMPEMDGFALLDWLVAHHPTVITIVLSGTTIVQDVIHAIHRGAFDFVAKPFSDNLLVEQIRRAVAYRRLCESHAELLSELQQKNRAVESQLSQLELAYGLLQSHALAEKADLYRAESIQQALLPRILPFHERVAFAAHYRPLNHVGGDFFDVFALDDRRLAVYIADTAGHGVSSALVTIFLKHAILPRGPQDAIQHTDPGQVLRAINAMLFNEMFGKDLFISMTYVVLDTQTCELQYGNAGHPPLLIRRANGEVESFRTPAPALGINSEVKYCAAACRLEPGDAFLLYTDGITEAGNPEGTFYGWERLSALAARLDGPPPALIDAIAEDLDAFRATQPLSDDVTFMALKLAPQPDARIALSPTPAAAENKEPTPAKSLRYAHTDGCAFLQISGSGTWAESHRMMELFRESQKNEDRLFLLDFSACGHLDSTFLGTLHQLCASSGQDRMPQVELQNLPRSLLKLMSELGLTAVLLHFRPKPRVLPESMALRDEPPPPHPDLGDTVLRAHEALIQADSRNAERFATVLQAFRAKSDS